MVTAQLGHRTCELESEFVIDIEDLRVFRYSDLCRCSKEALVDVSLCGYRKILCWCLWFDFWYSYRRDRDGLSMDWTDHRVLIKTDLRLLFDALSNLLTQLPEYASVCIGFVQVVTRFRCRVGQGYKGRNRMTIDIFRCVNCEYRYSCYKEHCFSSGGLLRNIWVPFLSLEVLAAPGSSLEKELIDSGVS